MRRPHRLHVDTFPFLAVLLAAMGSLILVLLVMDLRAKRAARARVAAQSAHQQEERQAEHDARRAELLAQEEARRREWEQKRAALQQDVQGRIAAVLGEVQKVGEQRDEAVRQDAIERRTLADLQQQATRERATIEAVRAEVQQGAARVEQAEAASSQARASLDKMGRELGQLEQTVQDLKESRRHDPRTYSVVPYKGKQGSTRRPLYVECAATGVIFHPDKVVAALPLAADVREELQRRVERQRPMLPAAHRNLPPYLLLLVRPDGIPAYYQLQAALRGLPLDFGYEFLDADWILDFPAEPPDLPAEPETSTLVRGGPGGPGGPGSGPGGGGPGGPGTGSAAARPGLPGAPRPGVPAAELVSPMGRPLPPLGSTTPPATHLPARPPEEPASPAQAPVPGPRPEPTRRPARITPPREWIVFVECKASGATLHPTRRDVAVAALESPHEVNPLRGLIADILQRQPQPEPGKQSPRLRVRFVVHPDGQRAYLAAYPALWGLPIDMDRKALQPGDDVQAALEGH